MSSSRRLWLKAFHFVVIAAYSYKLLMSDWERDGAAWMALDGRDTQWEMQFDGSQTRCVQQYYAWPQCVPIPIHPQCERASALGNYVINCRGDFCASPRRLGLDKSPDSHLHAIAKFAGG
ncbi:hypothetical protein P154DRAFT_225751 [Amniculicola lignicola CBS 123094]|uniref:Uncharacterized protein n=1 Tax=Amniculicola lignicola CBS 123094 TaxID=1392246 RepID=A0A6A5WGZ7_9PLEO|nr:hypothetical protein P154DRAFT_225751 [Amniculicola lignicola CBS 123094]